MVKSQVPIWIKAANIAGELLETMNTSDAAVEAGRNAHANQSPRDAADFHEFSASRSEDEEANCIPTVKLGPLTSQRNVTTPPTDHFNRLAVHNDSNALRRELETQEKIIVTLQRDNEALLREKKDTIKRFRELELKYEHLEAKHSLLLSSQQESDSRSSLRVANDAAKIVRLQADVAALQSALDAEKLKNTAMISLGAASRPLTNDSTPIRTPQLFSEQNTDHAPDRSTAKETLEENGDHAAKLREYERIYEIHKATIDTLHAEVERLENGKKNLEDRQRLYIRQVDDLTKRTHGLENNIAHKKESISELLHSCEGNSANAQHIKKQDARIKSLEAALVEKDDFTQRAMERLRSETKEICERYEKTIAAMQGRLESSKEASELQQRLCTLETENTELRRVIASGNTTSNLGAGPISTVVEDKPTAEGDPKAANSGEGTSGDAASSNNGAILRLEKQLNEAAAESAKYKEISSQLQSDLTEIHTEWDTRLHDMKRSFASQLQLLRSRHNDELKRLEAGHQSELLKLSSRKSVEEAEGFSSKLLRILERQGLDSSLIAICDRLHYLEKRSSQKEEEMAYELLETKRLAEMEKRILKEKTDLQLEQKNTQIKNFQLQLDELLSSIATLQAGP